MSPQLALPNEIVERVPLTDVEKGHAPCKVCVTGVSGYLASWIAKRLLLLGHHVVGTVRDVNGKATDELRALAEGTPGSIELVAAELTRDGSYDAAVAGCELVIHPATPVAVNVGKNEAEEKVVRPAIQGVENVLSAVEKSGTVKRVIYTGSMGAIQGDFERPDSYVHTEDDWATLEAATVPYTRSKILAEKRAWALFEAQAGEQRWELCVINPGFIMGPPLTTRASKSVDVMRMMLTGKLWPMIPRMGFPVCDVREVAAAHCVAACDAACRGRYIVGGPSMDLFEISDLLKPKYGHVLRLPAFYMPRWILWLAAPAMDIERGDAMKWMGRKSQASAERAKRELALEQLLVDKRVTMEDTAVACVCLDLVPSNRKLCRAVQAELGGSK
ncbi:unnamed protein product [Pedinophyceae sp. YPF-701]|nr:unnamed protein product [Pedinophyceae sp. YPF-701]